MAAGEGERSGPGESGAALATAFAVLYALALGASYLKADLTKNDFERFDDLRLTVVFFALFLGLCAAYAALYRGRPRLSLPFVFSTGAVFAALMLATFPVGSRDVFGYAFVGRMLGVHGVDPFLVSPSTFTGDPWLAYTTQMLTRPVTAYGPLFVLQAWLLDVLGGNSLWLTVVLHKAWAALAGLGCCALVVALRRGEASDASLAWTVSLLAWNPLVWFETAGAAHNDVSMALMVLLTLWCWTKGRTRAALAILAASFFYKWYSLLFLPALLIDRGKAHGFAVAARDAAIFSAMTAVLGVVLFLPFPGAAAGVLVGLFDPEKVRGIFPTELSPILAVLFWGLRSAGLFDSDLGFRLFDLIRYGLFAAAVGVICVRQWRMPSSRTAVIEACCLIALAFFLLLITQLWPWHLLVAVALAVAAGREPFLLIAVLLTELGLLSYQLTFAIATLMLVAIAASLSLLRRRQAETV